MYIKKEIRGRFCLNCHKEFLTGYKYQQFCSHNCSREYNRVSYRLNGCFENLNLSAGNKGAINELLVCLDLLKKGYDVFRAVSPSSSCDLIVLKDKKLFRVEVTSGWIRKGKKYSNKNQRDLNKMDILAIVFKSEIVYEGL